MPDATHSTVEPPSRPNADGGVWGSYVDYLAAVEADAVRLRQELDEAKAELKRVKEERIISVVFGHHKGAPKPFCLYRREDVSGVSGTGVVAVGCEFPDDGLVVLRWTSAWPTSVVFHERGIDSVKAIHGHDGRTEIVWLSDELEPLAEMEQRLERAEAERDRFRRAEQDAWNEKVEAEAERDEARAAAKGIHLVCLPDLERDQARAERDEARHHLEAARTALAASTGSEKRLIKERDKALFDCDEERVDREAAQRARHRAEAERDRMLDLYRKVEAWAEVERTRTSQTEQSSIWLHELSQRRDGILFALDAYRTAIPAAEPTVDGDR